MTKTAEEETVIIDEIYHSWLMADGHNALDHALEMWAKGPDHSVTKAKNAGWNSNVPLEEWPEHWEVIGQHIIKEMDVWICNVDDDLSKIRRPDPQELLAYKQMFEDGQLGPQGQASGSKFSCDVDEVVFRS